MHIALLFLSGALLLASRDLFESRDEEPYPFENVKDAEPLKVRSAHTAVFRSEAAWTAFWRDHVTRITAHGEQVSPPAVDFDRDMLIAVF